MIVWLGMFLLAAAWFFIVPVYADASIIWIVFVAAGVILIIRGISVYDNNKNYEPVCILKTRQYIFISICLIAPLLIAVVIMPLQWKIPAVLLAAGLILSITYKKRGYVPAGLLASGTIMLFQSIALQVFWKIAPRLQGESLFDSILVFIGNLVGLGASSYKNAIFLNHPTGTIGFSSTFDKFGIFLLVLMFAGCWGVILFFKSNTRLKILKFAAVLIFYGLVRYLFILAVLTDDGHVDLFWSMPVQVITMALLPFLLSKIIPLQGSRDEIVECLLTDINIDKKQVFTVTLMCMAFVCFFTAAFYNEPGTKKGDRVLMDEKHCDWEWSDKVYDTEWYGEKSNYNYYCLYDYLSHYYSMARNYDEITDKLLSNYDILILKTPTEPFGSSEMDSIVRFVENGGSVFMIGDHTNVFGISTNFNMLSQRFGFKYRYDSTYDLDSGSLSEYEHPAVIPHPAVQNLPFFLFATSCTIDAPLWVEDIITGYSLKSVDADYSQDNFFPEDGNSPLMRTGLFLQAIGIRYGIGRVAAFSDSTVFSNFWMFMPGKPELFMGTMEWLDRYNSFPTVKVITLALGALFSILSVKLLHKKKLNQVLLILFNGAIWAGLITPLICMAANKINYRAQSPHTAYTTIAYERQYSDFCLPVSWKEFMASPEKMLDTFYVWNQRLGYVPNASGSIEEAIMKGSTIVVVNPKDKISTEDAQKLKEAVAGGKSLLLLGAGTEGIDEYNTFAKLFGIELLPVSTAGQTAYYNNGKLVMLTNGALSLKGGKQIIATADDKQVGCEVEYGRGKVIAFADAGLFYNSSMGNLNIIPGEHQSFVGQLEFWILKRLVGN